jgi:hypothetical protein
MAARPLRKMISSHARGAHALWTFARTDIGIVTITSEANYPPPGCYFPGLLALGQNADDPIDEVFSCQTVSRR